MTPKLANKAFRRNQHNSCVWNAITNLIAPHFVLVAASLVTDTHRMTTVS